MLISFSSIFYQTFFADHNLTRIYRKENTWNELVIKKYCFQLLFRTELVFFWTFEKDFLWKSNCNVTRTCWTDSTYLVRCMPRLIEHFVPFGTPRGRGNLRMTRSMIETRREPGIARRYFILVATLHLLLILAEFCLVIGKIIFRIFFFFLFLHFLDLANRSDLVSFDLCFFFTFTLLLLLF